MIACASSCGRDAQRRAPDDLADIAADLLERMNPYADEIEVRAAADCFDGA